MKNANHNLPEGWNMVKLDDLAELITKGTTPTTNGFSFQSKGINFIKIENLLNDGQIDIGGTTKISDEANTSLKRSILQKNDILFSIAGAIGKTAIIRNDYIPANTNQALAIIRLKDGQEVEFINYLLNSDFIKSQTNNNKVQLAQANISLTQLKNLDCFLPPLPQQQKIAQILSTIDSQIQKTDEIIKETDKLKKGLMQELFTKGIGHKKFKKTKLGMIPEKWSLAKLRDICSVIIDCPHTTPKYFKDGDYLVVRTPNVRDGKLILDEALYTNKENYTQRISRYKPKENDVLLTREAPAGEACLVPSGISLCLGQRMMCLGVNTKLLNPSYLMYIFYSQIIRNMFQIKSSGTTVFHFNVKDIRDIEITLPSLTEQLGVVNMLDNVSKKLAINSKIKDELIKLKFGLMQDLLTGKKLVN